MNILQKLTILSLGSLLLLASKDNNLKVGEQSATLLLKTLGKNMKQHMKSGGPMSALDFCSNEAYSLTQKVNMQLPKGVSVKRISAKYRNPLNKLSQSELKVLNSLHGKPVLVEVSPTTYKYYKPLVIKKKVCLKCHGVNIDKSLKAEIQSRYPQDKAMGYKMNDLRGAIVVTIEKPLP